MDCTINPRLSLSTSPILTTRPRLYSSHDRELEKLLYGIVAEGLGEQYGPQIRTSIHKCAYPRRQSDCQVLYGFCIVGEKDCARFVWARWKDISVETFAVVEKEGEVESC